nr:cysteine-rich repeat secretory protein 38-like [Ipomoea batatas]
MANSKLFCLLPLLFIAAVVLTTQTAMAIIIPSVNPIGYNCSNFRNYTINSKYPNNVDKLLGNLASETPINDGFSSGSAGQYIDKVYGLALCRGDASNTSCKSCLDYARTAIRQFCSNNQNGIIWYDSCLLKYSEYDFIGKIDNVNKLYLSSPSPVRNRRGAFLQKRDNLLKQLAVKAAGQKSFYATDDVKFDESVNVYGLVQCTRDLSGEDCRKCLNGAIAELPKCCRAQRGGRVMGGSCIVRYEIYPFYN